MREKVIERKLVQAVRQCGGLALKFVSPGFNGVPDRLLLFPDGRLAFCEVKAPGQNPRPLQLRRFAQLRALGFLNLYACIGDPDTEDEYLTRASERFHQRRGFVRAGTFHQCGYKFGRWYNMIWMEKIIGEHREGADP